MALILGGCSLDLREWLCNARLLDFLAPLEKGILLYFSLSPLSGFEPSRPDSPPKSSLVVPTLQWSLPCVWCQLKFVLLPGCHGIFFSSTELQTNDSVFSMVVTSLLPVIVGIYIYSKIDSKLSQPFLMKYLTEDEMHIVKGSMKKSILYAVLTTTTTWLMLTITETCLFKYLNFTTKKNEYFQIKDSDNFSYFCSKHRLWVFVRTASPRRF